MLKVECESCKAPYQIDERRVPPAGLKMRCPKCGHSFLVSAAAPAPAPIVDLPAPIADLPARRQASKADPAKRTMVGVGVGVAPPGGPPRPPPPPAAAKRTVVGV